MERVRDPHFEPVEFFGGDEIGHDLDAEGRGERDQRAFGDPGESREVVRHDAQGVATPPDERAVVALDDETFGRDDHGFVRAGVVCGGSEHFEPLEVGPFDQRSCARIVVGRDEPRGFGAVRGRTPQQTEDRPGVACDEFDPREPGSLFGEHLDGCGEEARRLVAEGRVVGLHRGDEPCLVHVEGEHPTGIQQPGVAHEDFPPRRGDQRVQRAVLPLESLRLAHSIKRMGQHVSRIALDRWIPAERVVESFGEREDVLWFDAGVESDEQGVLPREGHPERTLVGWGSELLQASAVDPGALEAVWDRVAADTSGERGDEDPLGWWGWVGYGAGAGLLEPGDAQWAEALGDPEDPDVSLLRVDRALVYDHAQGSVTLVVRGDHRPWAAQFVAWWAGVAAVERAPKPSPVAQVDRVAVAEWADSGSHYLELIARCQEAIREGDAFVVCLTTSVSVREIPDDDVTLYGRLRHSSPAPRAVFARLGGISLLGSSPETFLTVSADGVATASPIKGTRPRGENPVADERLAHELRDSEKEHAENIMIVDLLRNDLGRVAVPGTVEVTSLVATRSYTHVHQLVSTIRARLRPGVTGVDAVRATFPPGSMTGAPKHSVVGLLSRLEAAPRGVYSGVVGRFGTDGSVDLSVVIRSIVFDAASRVARVGVGGGITSSSVPLDELAEIRTKAAPLLDVLGAFEAVQAGDAPPCGAARDVSVI
jgi:para-aminobenzoate synthetase component 1